VVEGRPALLIVPAKPAPGKPWIWRAEWFGHFPQADLALVARGWHVGYMNAQDLYGSPPAMALFDAYYRRVTADYGLNAKVVMEGFSRGGLYAFNFAAQYPDRIAALTSMRRCSTSTAGPVRIIRSGRSASRTTG